MGLLMYFDLPSLLIRYCHTLCTLSLTNTDLLESGKARSRVFSEPLHGSPTHSPVTHARGSPLQRAALSSSTESTVPSRVSQTLPPPVLTLEETSNEKVTPIIPRRPTYPLPHKIRSEPSAFTSVLGITALSEDELASTVTLTESQTSIPGESRLFRITFASKVILYPPKFL